MADSDWYEDPHWDGAKARAGVTTHYVDVRFDVLLGPREEPILARRFLDAPPFSDQHWDTQSSGIEIREHVAAALEEEWASFSGLETPQEVPGAGTYPEGATRRITVNAYERSRQAAERCVDHHGHACDVCGFDFGRTYGDAGEGFIHVHHLKPLSEIRGEYRVDPIRDLRPVCPNCHAMALEVNGVGDATAALFLWRTCCGAKPWFRRSLSRPRPSTPC